LPQIRSFHFDLAAAQSKLGFTIMVAGGFMGAWAGGFAA
jgi:hypothetical protein